MGAAEGKQTYAATSVQTSISAILNKQAGEVQYPDHQVLVLFLPRDCLWTVLKLVFDHLLLEYGIEAVEKWDPVVKIATRKRPISRKGL